MSFVISLFSSFHNDYHQSDLLYFFFFFKQKTAYDMRISDWSSDVCSSDLEGMMPRTRRPACRPWGRAPAPRTERMAALRLGRGKIGRASCRERVCQYV